MKGLILKFPGDNDMPVNGGRDIIVIGGGVAGINVILQLIKSGQQFNITCITQEKYYDYSTCGMPYVLEGVVSKPEDLILRKPEFFSEKGVKLLTESEVIAIDLANHQVKFSNKFGTDEQLHYDYLIIATGRVPFKPPIPGIELDRVYTLMNLDECMRLLSELPHGNSGIVIGGGAIGLEVALAFNTHKINTSIVEIAPSVLPVMLDPDMGKLVEDWLTNKGIKIYTNSKVQEIKGSQQVESIILGDGTELEADIVLLSTGIRPNVALSKKAGLDIGSVGGIVTNNKQNVYRNKQLIEDVFALGDCVETNNLLTNQPMISALASTAILQARAIAENISGTPSELRGNINPALTYLDGLHVGSVGLTSHSAERSGLTFKSATTMGKSQSRYIPGWKNIHFKFLSHNNKLIGAQIIGETDVKERINALTLAIRENISIKTLLQTERCYTPPLSLLTDPMFKALEQLI